MITQIPPCFDEILAPLGQQAAVFFLAASLYHAHKISFATAAALAELNQDEFLYRLKEHFNSSYLMADEVILEDITTVEQLMIP
jgi:hypothetical protein